jgi:hypothetical protein
MGHVVSDYGGIIEKLYDITFVPARACAERLNALFVKAASNSFRSYSSGTISEDPTHNFISTGDYVIMSSTYTPVGANSIYNAQPSGTASRKWLFGANIGHALPPRRPSSLSARLVIGVSTAKFNKWCEEFNVICGGSNYRLVAGYTDRHPCG